MREIKDDENHSEEPSERKPLFTRAAPVIDPPPSAAALPVVLLSDLGGCRPDPGLG